VNLDDCWAVSRDAQDNIQPDPNAFPSGMRALADYVHSRKLKFGLYSGTRITYTFLFIVFIKFSLLNTLDAGTKTCAGRPASLGYETKDANTYANWTVDYLKYDNCYSGGSTAKTRYSTMRDALNATKRSIFFSMCGMLFNY